MTRETVKDASEALNRAILKFMEQHGFTDYKQAWDAFMQSTNETHLQEKARYVRS